MIYVVLNLKKPWGFFLTLIFMYMYWVNLNYVSINIIKHVCLHLCVLKSYLTIVSLKIIMHFSMDVFFLYHSVRKYERLKSLIFQRSTPCGVVMNINNLIKIIYLTRWQYSLFDSWVHIFKNMTDSYHINKVIFLLIFRSIIFDKILIF